jgi:hypothetical protein
MPEEQKIYPRGQIALDNGDLIDVTNVKMDHTNNAKQVHTIRQKGAGITLGVEETNITFDMVINEDGFERDYFTFVKKGRVKQLRLKVPGKTYTVNGTFKDQGLELPLDDSIKMSMAFCGHMEDT